MCLCTYIFSYSLKAVVGSNTKFTANIVPSRAKNYVPNYILVLLICLFFSVFSKDSSTPLCYMNIPDFGFYSITLL